MALAEVTLKDDSGTLRAVWFGQDYLARVFAGCARVFHGDRWQWNGPALRNPDYELFDGR